MKDVKRVTIFCGHYGSGKTSLAVNYAFALKKEYDKVSLADLDIVNPYFRSKDYEEELKEAGIRIIVSEYANSNVDIPALPADLYSITRDLSHRVVLDIGGDDRGAYVLGRLAPEILAEHDYEMIMVANRFRPLTPDVESTLEVMEEIRMAGGIPFTGIINNSNLGRETTKEDVLASMDYGKEIAKKSGLPLLCTTCEWSLYEALQGEQKDLQGIHIKRIIM